nr:hypothetical protein [Sphingobium sp. CECT 9361]
MPSASSEGGDHCVLGDARLDGDVIGRGVSNEDRAAVGLGAFMAQIICDRVTSGGRQWKAIGEMRLGSGYANDPVPPVNVVDPQLGDFGAPESKVGDASHHRISAPPGRQSIIK